MAHHQFTPYWERKIRTEFKHLDVDHDNEISVKDFELVGERFIKATNLSAEEAKATRGKFGEAYRKYFDIELKPMTSDDFVANWKKMGVEGIKKICDEFFPDFFKVVDTDHDGVISPKEFAVFNGFYGIDEATAKDAFKHLDTNHDGHISKEEFVQAALNFHLLEKEGDPSEHFYGPLVH